MTVTKVAEKGVKREVQAMGEEEVGQGFPGLLHFEASLP